MVMVDRAVDVVRRYYDRVDSGDVAGLLDLFASDAVYRRPGYRPLVGRAELAEFYRSQRVIESGQHTLQRVTADEGGAAVHGEFTGVLKDGSDAHVRFADFFVFNQEGKFATRDTFFFVPSV